MTFKMVVENPGFLTTVQDLGRYGYQQFGMPVAGAMDDYALQAANLLVGNPRGEAGLEITYSGFSTRFEGRGRVAVTGADLGAKLNGRPLEPWQSVVVEDGDMIVFTAVKKGCRAYMALEGGVSVPEVMGSKSTYIKAEIGGYNGRKLVKGDVLESGEKGHINFEGSIRVPDEFLPQYSGDVNVRLVMGPQDDCFPPEEIEKFLNSKYAVTNQCDRMGYRLEGPAIKHSSGPDIISDGIALGAIQVPGHGRPIIMMRDRQTTGGYTKIANVISVDIPLLAQLKPGDRVSFTRVSVEEAQALFREREELLKRLEDYLRSKDKFFNYCVKIRDREFRISVQRLL